VNTVFQSYALFPHMTVRENVAFGLRMRNVPRGEIEGRVHSVMELTRISELAGRKPSQISGGQKQRVALARALVNEPDVLLLDEPLGALDLKLRKELQQELRALQRRTGITFIYVTHDQDEALSMSDRIAVMDNGSVIQLGSPVELYEKPRTRFVAQFLGGCNLLRAQVMQRNGREIVAETSIGKLRVDTAEARDEFTLAIRPEKILFRKNGAVNCFPGEVIETTYAGAETRCVARVGRETLHMVSVNVDAARLNPGEHIYMMLPTESLIVLED
jgi:spermidine/putrescine transport system ATP-binding protein